MTLQDIKKIQGLNLQENNCWTDTLAWFSHFTYNTREKAEQVNSKSVLIKNNSVS